MALELATRVRAAIRDIPDFPKPGILFKDIMPVLADASLMADVIAYMAKQWHGDDIGCIVGMESRGFLFGMPLSIEMGVPFAPARKPGKLPYSTVSTSYELEYGTNTLEMHTDAIAKGQRVLIIDDLLATGGTAKATQQLIHDLGGTVAGFQFLVELDFLGGRSALGEARVDSLVHY